MVNTTSSAKTALSSADGTAGPSCVEVLRFRELSQEYQCQDYLRANSSSKVVITMATRVEMLNWLLTVSVYMKFATPDIPITAATLLDRFLQTPEGHAVLTSLPEYRLATMACLYLTAKVHDPCVVISSATMAALSQGMFSAEQVEEMERTILKALKWRANPPTALAFVREFLLLLPCSVSTTIKEQAFELCLAQIQRCMLDYDAFALTEASMIAFFAVHNALQSLGMDSIIIGHIAAIFSYATHTDYYSQPDKELVLQNSLLGRREDADERGGEAGAKRRGSSKRRSKGHRKASRRSSATSTTTTTSSSSSSSSSSSRQSWSRRSINLDKSPRGVVQA